MEWRTMKYSLSPWVGGGRESLPEKEKKEERLQILQIVMIGQNRVPEKDFEAFRGAELMKMTCRSVWDHSRGPKPPKMIENLDFFRISRIFGVENAWNKGPAAIFQQIRNTSFIASLHTVTVRPT